MARWGVAGLFLAAALFSGCGRRADLQPFADPLRGEAGRFCQLDEQGRLVITIVNRGRRPSKATTTRVDFLNHPPVFLPTRPVAPDQTASVTFPLPEVCFDPDCHFVLNLDWKEEVPERNETNNRSQGVCPQQ